MPPKYNESKSYLKVEFVSYWNHFLFHSYYCKTLNIEKSEKIE